jgi:hypothetical protein
MATRSVSWTFMNPEGEQAGPATVKLLVTATGA